MPHMKQKAGKAATKNRDFQDKVLALRIAGGSYSQIAKSLGKSRSATHAAAVRAMIDLTEKVKEKAEHVREIECARCDAIIATHWSAKDDPRSADIILKASKRRSDLLGLDAPVRSEVATPIDRSFVTEHHVVLEKMPVEDLRLIKEIYEKNIESSE
jgi:hypothetical protein